MLPHHFRTTTLYGIVLLTCGRGFPLEPTLYLLLKVLAKIFSGGEIFRTCPDRPWGPPSLLYNRYRVFPGGKAAGAWRWPPTPI